jgi:hypothetical protein
MGDGTGHHLAPTLPNSDLRMELLVPRQATFASDVSAHPQALESRSDCIEGAAQLLVDIISFPFGKAVCKVARANAYLP